jgi:hypothetical protein
MANSALVTRKTEFPKYDGDLSILKRFQNSDVYCGNIEDGRFAIVGPRMKIRFVGDFFVTDRNPYPVIKIEGKDYQVHRVVAFSHGKIKRI